MYSSSQSQLPIKNIHESINSIKHGGDGRVHGRLVSVSQLQSYAPNTSFQDSHFHHKINQSDLDMLDYDEGYNASGAGVSGSVACIDTVHNLEHTQQPLQITDQIIRTEKLKDYIGHYVASLSKCSVPKYVRQSRKLAKSYK